MTTTSAGPGIALSSAAGRAVLATTVLGSGMAMLDGTVVNVATVRIGRDFGAGFAALQWVLNGYLLALASLILLGGSLGDRLGHRRVFLVGVVWFAAASVLCAVSVDVQMLIGARVLQGIGGALLTPGSLAILSATIAPGDRAAAVGAWSGLGGMASALGPFVGGFLVQDVSWRWAFGLNVPVAVAVVLLGRRYVPETRAEHRAAHLDVPGTVLITLALAALTYGTTTAGDSGWTARPVTLVAVGAALLVTFVQYERRSPQPLVPPSLFRDRTFTGANIMTFMTYGALGALLFTLSLQLQVSARYGPLAAGVSMLPTTVLMLLFARRSGKLAARIGPRLQLTVGPLVAATGLLLTTRIDATHTNYLLYVLPGMVLFGAGMTTLVAPLTATVMAAVPDDQVGIASGVNNAVARAASLLAVALLPALAGLSGEKYRVVATMVHGYRSVALACAGLMVLGSLVVSLTVRNRLQEG